MVYFKYLPSNDKMSDCITRFLVSFNSIYVILTFVPFVKYVVMYLGQVFGLNMDYILVSYFVC